MPPTFVTLPNAGIRLNLAQVIAVQDFGRFTRVSTTAVTHTESGYPTTQDIELDPADADALYAALDRAGGTDTEARRARFTDIRRRLVAIGADINRRSVAQLFGILDELNGALVRLVDEVEGER